MEMIQKKSKRKMFLDLLKAIFSLVASYSLYQPDKIQYNEWQLSNILLSTSILLFTYYFAFVYFKKNKGFVKFLFFLENIVLSFVSIGLFLKPLVTNKYLANMLELTNIIAYIFIVHFLIQIYVYYTKKEQKKSNFSFFLYLILFGISSYSLGAKFDLHDFILKVLSVILLVIFLFYLFIFFKSIHKIIKDKKQLKKNEISHKNPQPNVKPFNNQ
jgi:hypothetical protein